MNNEKIDKQKLLKALLASSGGKINPNAINGAVNNNDTGTLLNSLSAEDRQKINRVMSDKKSLEQTLKSPEAQVILKSILKGGGKNG